MRSTQFRLVILFLIVLFISDTSHGQQILKRNNGKSEKITIIRMDSTSLHYYKYDDRLEIEYIIPIVDILYLYMTDFSEQEKIDPQMLEMQRKKMVKLSLSGFIRNTIMIGYEQSIRPRYSMEAMYMLVGLKEEFGQKYYGHGIQLGFKYRLSDPFKLSKKKKIKHLMEGLYTKPLVGFITRNVDNNTENLSDRFFYGGLQIGYMMVNNRMSLEIFGGYHYIQGSSTKTPFRSGIEIPSPLILDYGEFDGRNDTMFSYGVRIGRLF